jgi:phosphoserine phosphatase RsbU/P
MFKNRGLAFKQCVYILMFVITIFVLIFSYITVEFRALVLHDVERAAQNLTRATANKLDQTFQVAASIARQNASMIESGENLQKEIKDVLVDNMQNINDHPEIYGMSIAFAENTFEKDKKFSMYYAYRCGRKIKMAEPAGPNYNYFHYNWFTMPKILNRPIWSEPYFDKGAGDIIMTTYSVPFYRTVNGKKEFWGVATVDLSLSWLQKIVHKMKMYNKDYACLISKSGRFVTHPDVDLIMNQSIFSLAKQKKNQALWKIGRAMTAGKEGFGKTISHLYKEPSWMYYTPIESNEWSLAVLIPENELFAELDKIQLHVLLLGIVGLIGLLLVVIAINLKVTKPLRHLTKVTKDIGAGNFAIPIPDFKGGDEISILGQSFKATQKALIEHIENLKQTTAAKERIESELSIARDIQEGILPQHFPVFPQYDEFELAASLESAKAVGGDLYDFFLLSDKHLCFVIGDVSGKGIPASLFMAMTQTLQRSIAELGMSPGEIVTKLSKVLRQNNETFMFVTYFLCVLNLETGNLHFSNAGHNPPYIMKADGAMEQIETLHGPPIAISDNEYASTTIKLEENSMIFLYTDGVTEAMDKDHNQFSDPKLAEILKENTHIDNPKMTIEAVNNAVKKFADGIEQSDDITMLALSYYGKNPHTDHKTD